MKALGSVAGGGVLFSLLFPHALPFLVAGLVIGAAFGWLGRGYSERRQYDRFLAHSRAITEVRSWADKARVAPFRKREDV